MGHAADPDQTGEAGRARHGAAVGCAHERHQLRRLHPARVAGILYRRAAGAGEERRQDHAGCRRAHHQSRCVRGGACKDAAPNGSSRRPASSAAMAGCSPATSSRPTRAAISISSKPPSARRSASRRFINAVIPGRAFLRVQLRRSAATKQSTVAMPRYGLLRYARDDGGRQNDNSWDGNHDKTQRRHPQQAQDRLHRDGGHRAVQARLSHPDDPGRASA